MKKEKKHIGIIAGVIILPLLVAMTALGLLGCTFLFYGGQEAEEDETAPVTSSDVPIIEETQNEQPAGSVYIDEFKVKEISRDSSHKKMEMFTWENNWEITRKIVFELPVEWEGTSSVFAATPEPYSMKVDMWQVASTTREGVLDEFNSRGIIIKEDEFDEIISENIYFTEHYEVFHRKYLSHWEFTCIIHTYILYANEESFTLAGYVFVEDLPEYDDIFKRIAESVIFQF